MRINDKESDLATNLMLLLFMAALLGFGGNALMYAGSNNQIIAVTQTAKR